jgi:hypothetical protein
VIGTAVAKAELFGQMIEMYRIRKAMPKETGHAFRNRITIIGGFSRRIVELSENMDLAKEVRMVYETVQALET